MRFLNEVDAACVYVNASTRFTDGAQFGLARGRHQHQKDTCPSPLGSGINSYKWIISARQVAITGTTPPVHQGAGLELCSSRISASERRARRVETGNGISL